MSKQSFDIWGRTLDLDIVFDCYAGEDILAVQNEALEVFSKKAASIFEIAKEKAEQYCLKNNGEEIGSAYIGNLFRYVKPKAIYIKRTTNNDHVVAIICAYKFNPDDGLVIVFKNEKFSAIGTENIIL